jgi:hypothetical protein
MQLAQLRKAELLREPVRVCVCVCVRERERERERERALESVGEVRE